MTPVKRYLVGMRHDDSGWLKAQRAELPYGTLRGNTSPNMKVMRTLKPKSVRRLGDRYMVDFGQNMAGWIKIAVSDVTKGDTVTAPGLMWRICVTHRAPTVTLPTVLRMADSGARSSPTTVSVSLRSRV